MKAEVKITQEERDYDELCFYTLAHRDPSFVHQHVVDAFAAQHSSESDKPIKLTFALAGLYLHVEKGLSGRDVQLAHMTMARRKRKWPTFVLPGDRGSITASDVVAVPAGRERDRMIDAWCSTVWAAFGESRPIVVNLVRQLLHAD